MGVLNKQRMNADMSTPARQENLFSLLPERRAPWTEFIFGTGAQALAVALLIWVRLLYPSVVSSPEHTFRSVQLVSTPVPVNHEPQPVRQLPQPKLVAQLDPPPSVVHLPTPQPKV